MRTLGLVVLLAALGQIAAAADSISTGVAVYRLSSGSREGQEIWIVDGAAVRKSLYPEFLYGGNSERYLFIPRGEIWIDNAIAAEEFAYTVAHELHERTRAHWWSNGRCASGISSLHIGMRRLYRGSHQRTATASERFREVRIPCT
jgi:hypothetical protein